MSFYAQKAAPASVWQLGNHAHLAPPRQCAGTVTLTCACVRAEARCCTSTKTGVKTSSASRFLASMAARISGYVLTIDLRVMPLDRPSPFPSFPPRGVAHVATTQLQPPPTSLPSSQEASPPFSLSGAYIMMVDRGPGDFSATTPARPPLMVPADSLLFRQIAYVVPAEMRLCGRNAVETEHSRPCTLTVSSQDRVWVRGLHVHARRPSDLLALLVRT